MKLVFIAKDRNIWPLAWLREAMGVSRSAEPIARARSRSDETVGRQAKASFLASDRTYGARSVWRDLWRTASNAGLHRIERLTRLQALRARPRRRRLPKAEGDRQVAHVPATATIVARPAGRRDIPVHHRAEPSTLPQDRTDRSSPALLQTPDSHPVVVKPTGVVFLVVALLSFVESANADHFRNSTAGGLSPQPDRSD